MIQVETWLNNRYTYNKVRKLILKSGLVRKIQNLQTWTQTIQRLHDRQIVFVSPSHLTSIFHQSGHLEQLLQTMATRISEVPHQIDPIITKSPQRYYSSILEDLERSWASYPTMFGKKAEPDMDSFFEDLVQKQLLLEQRTPIEKEEEYTVFAYHPILKGQTDGVICIRGCQYVVEHKSRLLHSQALPGYLVREDGSRQLGPRHPRYLQLISYLEEKKISGGISLYQNFQQFETIFTPCCQRNFDTMYFELTGIHLTILIPTLLWEICKDIAAGIEPRTGDKETWRQVTSLFRLDDIFDVDPDCQLTTSDVTDRWKTLSEEMIHRLRDLMEEESSEDASEAGEVKEKPTLVTRVSLKWEQKFLFTQTTLQEQEDRLLADLQQATDEDSAHWINEELHFHRQVVQLNSTSPLLGRREVRPN